MPFYIDKNNKKEVLVQSIDEQHKDIKKFIKAVKYFKKIPFIIIIIIFIQVLLFWNLIVEDKLYKDLYAFLGVGLVLGFLGFCIKWSIDDYKKQKDNISESLHHYFYNILVQKPIKKIITDEEFRKCISSLDLNQDFHNIYYGINKLKEKYNSKKADELSKINTSYFTYKEKKNFLDVGK